MKRNLKKNWLVAVAAFVAVSFIGCSNPSDTPVGGGGLPDSGLGLPTVADVLPGIQTGSDIWGSGSNITKTGDYYTITSGTGWDSNGSASIPCCFEAGKISGAKGATAVVDLTDFEARPGDDQYPTYELKVQISDSECKFFSGKLQTIGGQTCIMWVFDGTSAEAELLDNAIQAMITIRGEGTVKLFSFQFPIE